MTTLPHHVPSPLPGTEHLETQAGDIYVLATRVVHRAETLLAGAEGHYEAIAHIELAFALALSVTADSTWADVRAAREHLDLAQESLVRSAYRIR
jgi:hypothetical protein